MDELIIHEKPEAKIPNLVVAFAGWPDAAEAATRAIRHLTRKLPAKKFAEIDPENFYDFTESRPQTRINRKGERSVRWPTNDFYYYLAEDPSQSLVLYMGTEPNLRWRGFSEIITSVAEMCGVEMVVSLGSLLDAVPHTREVRVTGRASSVELTQKVEWLGVSNSSYQGPTGIHTAFWHACDQLGISNASIWGHCPHYVNTSPNPKVSLALLTKLRSLISFSTDFEELRIASETFEEEVTSAIDKEPSVGAYVKRLEEKYDASTAQISEVPNPDEMVKELENFLKSQRQQTDQGDQSERHP